MPDLIICDVVMPEMDGITFTSKIKSNRKTSHIPVIILTARTSLIYKKEGYETGADEYITKPFSESLLRTRIRSIIRNRELIKMKLQNEFITEPKELAISTPDQQFLEDMMKIIEENIDSQELKAEFICRELAMSHSVVYKKVKALTGLSLIEFIRDFKLKRAAQLMAKYQFSIVDACHKVGFSDRKYFTQIFKSKFGMTPSEYIKVNLN
jgi:YesN/AraC family two-component response regulator